MESFFNISLKDNDSNLLILKLILQELKCIKVEIKSEFQLIFHRLKQIFDHFSSRRMFYEKQNSAESSCKSYNFDKFLNVKGSNNEEIINKRLLVSESGLKSYAFEKYLTLSKFIQKSGIYYQRDFFCGSKNTQKQVTETNISKKKDELSSNPVSNSFIELQPTSNISLCDNDVLILLLKLILKELICIRIELLSNLNKLSQIRGCSAFSKLSEEKLHNLKNTLNSLNIKFTHDDNYVDVDNNSSSKNIFNSDNSLKSIAFEKESKSNQFKKIKKKSSKVPCKQVQCSICGEFKTNIEKHLRTHTGERPYRCGICRKSFIDSYKLKIHKRIHSGERPYSCSICEKTFTLSETLRKHILSHSAVKPHKCLYCDKSFTRKWLLTNHIRKHTGEHPYKCSICPKSYSRFGSLTQHMRTHEELSGKSFKCKLCKKLFRSQADLKRHHRIHTGEKPFSCELCFKHFSLKGNLQNHLKTHQK